jgi:hypothetical protein
MVAILTFLMLICTIQVRDDAPVRGRSHWCHSSISEFQTIYSIYFMANTSVPDP